jgi:hypothetical protein
MLFMGARRWTQEELDQLRLHANNGKGVLEISGLLNRTTNSVMLKGNRVGILFRNFTPEEDQILMDHYARWDGVSVQIKSLSSLLGRDLSSIVTRAKMLGLTRRDRPKPYRRGLQLHRWKKGLKNLDQHRRRARKLFPELADCEMCNAAPAVDRHHKDNNPCNNEPSNIARLCRKCHMIVDGRLKLLGKREHVIVPLKPCIHCGSYYKPLRKGKCRNCYNYLHRTGRDRPIHGR